MKTLPIRTDAQHEFLSDAERDPSYCRKEGKNNTRRDEDERGRHEMRNEGGKSNLNATDG